MSINFRINFIMIVCVCMLFLGGTYSNKANAVNYGMITPLTPCPPGSVNTISGASLFYCWFTLSFDALWGAGATIPGGSGIQTSLEFLHSYVPVSGVYKLRAHLCRSTTVGKCTIAREEMYIDSKYSVSLNHSASIGDQNPTWGGAAADYKIDFSFNMCFTIVDTNGVQWSQGVDTECSDGHPLPVEPKECHINFGSDLNVSMGEMERSKIATQPSLGYEGNVKKTFNILCSDNIDSTSQIKFEFIPMMVNGTEVIQTSSSDVGVVIFYKGEVASLSTIYTEQLKPGYSDLEIEFQLVRNPNASIADISTGKFTASAVMIITEV